MSDEAARQEENGAGQMLAEQLERLFARRIDRDFLRAAAEPSSVHSVWSEVAELGVSAAAVPVDRDGAGLTWRELEIVLRTLGRFGAPIPLAETILAYWALALAGLETPEGMHTVATGVFTLAQGQNRISGCDPLVAWAPCARFLTGVATQGGERFVFVLPRDLAEIKSRETFGRIPSAQVTLRSVSPVSIAPAPAGIGPLGLLPNLAILRAVQIAGCISRVLPLCVDYANTRQQFGRPIAKFQAIQHSLAELAMQGAAAQVAGMFGCRAADAGETEYGAAIAKVRAGTAASRSAAIAHQMFGAIGITDEHELHHFTRRLWQWRAEAGSDHWWAERLGASTIARGGAALWPSISR
jgi:acyl-CoA dehydrogenase